MNNFNEFVKLYIIDYYKNNNIYEYLNNFNDNIYEYLDKIQDIINENKKVGRTISQVYYDLKGKYTIENMEKMYYKVLIEDKNLFDNDKKKLMNNFYYIPFIKELNKRIEKECYKQNEIYLLRNIKFDFLEKFIEIYNHILNENIPFKKFDINNKTQYEYFTDNNSNKIFIKTYEETQKEIKSFTYTTVETNRILQFIDDILNCCTKSSVIYRKEYGSLIDIHYIFDKFKDLYGNYFNSPYKTVMLDMLKNEIIENIKTKLKNKSINKNQIKTEINTQIYYLIEKQNNNKHNCLNINEINFYYDLNLTDKEKKLLTNKIYEELDGGLKNINIKLPQNNYTNEEQKIIKMKDQNNEIATETENKSEGQKL